MRESRGRSRRRRRNRAFVLGGTAVVLAAAVAAAGLIFKKGNFSQENLAAKKSDAAVISVQEASALAVSEMVTVEGIDITGLDRKAAGKRLLDQWKSAEISYEGAAVSIEEAMGPEIDSILDEIYAGGDAAAGAYRFSDDSLEEGFRKLAERLAGKWNRAAVDSEMASFDKETGIYTYSEAVPGRALNEEALVTDLMQAVRSGEAGSQVVPEFKEISPKRTAAQAKEQYQVIGSFTTQTTNNKNRNENIRLAVESIDGRILKPGEEFSFNLATGNRTKEKGYQPAGAYRNGVLIEEPGGGVCQVSTTLYNALVNSGFQATERHSHSFKPSYIQPGQDAMVSFDGYAGPDLKFVNTEQTTVAVRASLQDNTLKISIVGLPVLEDGVKVTMRSEQVKEVQAPEPVYEENGQLPAGTEKVVDSGQNGGVWKTFRVITKEGKVLEEKPLHNTTYRGKAPVIQKNVSAAETASGTDAGAGEAQTSVGETQAAAGETQVNAGKTPVNAGETSVNTGGEQRKADGQAAETGGQQTGNSEKAGSDSHSTAGQEPGAGTPKPGEGAMQQETKAIVIPAFPGAEE